MKRFLICLFAIVGPLAAQSTAPEDWSAWALWAEKLQPVTDAEGHGPDIGSDEWAQALAKKLGIFNEKADAPALRSKEWREAIESKLQPKQNRELLSSHDTEARFEGIKDHTCMGLTALCPDRCGHSGKLASFSIVRYLDYQKPGEYGDPKQERFDVLIEDNHGNTKVPSATRDSVMALKAGDVVRLKWNHDYVTQAGSKFPERPIISLKPLPKP
jgi:hypothetical protein